MRITPPALLTSLSTGSTGSWPAPGLGEGALRRLLDRGCDPATVRGLLLSHLHPDHLGGGALTPLLLALNYAPHMRLEASLSLLAHTGLKPFLAGLQDLFGTWLTPPPQRLAATWLQPGQELALSPWHLLVSAAEHAPQSLCPIAWSWKEPAWRLPGRQSG
ncbi:hypothetical protein DFAR_1860019 [Desulfarculales bacterium]